MFRVLLMNEVIEALGVQMQYTILPYVVQYIIDPETIAGGGMNPDLLFSLLAFCVLMGRLVAVYPWLWALNKYVFVAVAALQTVHRADGHCWCRIIYAGLESGRCMCGTTVRGLAP